MKKTKATANEPTIIERHNALFGQIEAAKTADDVRELVEAVKGFIVSYKSVDKAMTKRIYEKLLNKVNDMVAENEFVYQRINARLEEATNRAYDFSGEKDDSQAVQSKMLQLMSQMPKTINANNLNRINKTLNDAINSGVIGSKAVLELLKFPAYADSISATIRERAFNGSKSAAEQAFDRLKETERKNVEQALASVYLQGYRLRKSQKRLASFKKPTAWNPDGQMVTE